MTNTTDSISTPKFSAAFFRLEAQICDLAEMARIAVERVYQAVGELKIVDGKTTEAPDEADITSAMFAVGHLADMIKELRAEYYEPFKARSSLPDEDDAPLLALGEELEIVIRDWHAQQTVDANETARIDREAERLSGTSVADAPRDNFQHPFWKAR